MSTRDKMIDAIAEVLALRMMGPDWAKQAAEIAVDTILDKFADWLCSCPYRSIGHRLSVRVPDPECLIHGGSTVDIADIDIIKDRETDHG